MPERFLAFPCSVYAPHDQESDQEPYHRGCDESRAIRCREAFQRERTKECQHPTTPNELPFEVN